MQLYNSLIYHMRCVMRKPAFCLCINKCADQLCGNPAADLPHCFCYVDSTITLLLKSEKSSLYLLRPYSLICVRPALKPQRLVLLCHSSYMSLFVRKTDFCICENKDADQLRSNCAADQCLCFRYNDSTIPPLLKSKISSL